MITDTHAHLTDAKFDDDRDEVIKRAFDAGINKIIEISCEPGLWDKGREFVKKDNIFISYGIHPHEAQKASEKDFEKLEELLRDKKTVAIGEIGLDYYYDLSPRKTQREVLLRQLDIAAGLDKTLIIHCRSAYAELLTILENFKNLPKGVIHCFSGTPQEAEAYVEMGFMLGIDGPVTFPKSDKLRQIVAETDITKLLAETDCPYLAPQKYRGRRNEPAYITETVAKIAEIKNISFEEAAKITSDNAQRLFNLQSAI